MKTYNVKATQGTVNFYFTVKAHSNLEAKAKAEVAAAVWSVEIVSVRKKE